MKIDLFKVFMSKEASQSVSEVLTSGYIGQGPVVDLFEKQLSEFLSNHPVNINCVNSATSGIHLALHLAKDGIRDEVLTTPLTCVATNAPIVANNLKIKWVDCDLATCNIDLNDLRKKISKNTLAIVIVHWAGYSVDLAELESIKDDCERQYGHRPVVIEDCAHAFGATFNGEKLGATQYSNISVFSFQAIKHLTCGDGGAIITPNTELHQRAKLLRWYGLDRTSNLDFRSLQDIKEIGFKFHMNDINASIGIENLKYVPMILEKHRQNALYLRTHINHSELSHLSLDSNRESAHWIYTVRVNRRKEFMSKLNEFGISTSIVHSRNDHYTCFLPYLNELPALDKISQEMCNIPCGWWLNETDLAYIADCINRGW